MPSGGGYSIKAYVRIMQANPSFFRNQLEPRITRSAPVQPPAKEVSP